MKGKHIGGKFCTKSLRSLLAGRSASTHLGLLAFKALDLTPRQGHAILWRSQLSLSHRALDRDRLVELSVGHALSDGLHLRHWASDPSSQ